MALALQTRFPDPPDAGSDEDSRSTRSNPRLGKRRSKKNRSKAKKEVKCEYSTDDATSDTQERYTERGKSESDDDKQDRRRKRRRDRGMTLKVIRPVITLYSKAMDYRTYRLIERSTSFDAKVSRKVSKMTRRMDIQLKAQQFYPTVPITILSFLPAFKAACDFTGVHEGAGIWLFQFFVKKTAKAALTTRLTTSVDKPRKRDSQLATYPEVVDYLLRTYATEEIIAETDAALIQYRQAERMSPSDYDQELWTKALKCGTVYDEARLKGIFIEGLQESIRQSVRNYWGKKPEAELQELARHANSMALLRGEK